MSRHLAVEILSSYLDEEVTPSQLRLVEGHLGGCAECRRKLAGIRSVAAEVRRLEAVAPPPTLSAAVEHRVRLASLEDGGRFRLEQGLRRWMGQPVLAPVFAIVLALGAILYLFAFGVSKVEQTTRLVVAAAPSEEDGGSFAAPKGPIGDHDTSGARSDEGPADDRGVAAPKRPAASERMANPVSKADAAESLEAQKRGERAAKLEREITEVASGPAQVGEVHPTNKEAQGLAAGEIASVSKAGAEARPAFAAEAPAFSEKGLREREVREVQRRRFFADGGIWVEVGLEGEPAVEVVEWSADSDEFESELAALRNLGRVRLRVDGRVVEIVYPEATPRD